jgi:hypothetical protein
MLGSASSLVGSIWFGLMLCLAGYVAGHIFPINRFSGRK